MCHTSPTVELVWTILSATELAYFIFHLYNFDRFKCLRIWESQNKGAFKKVMTFSYLLAVPLLLARSLIFAVVKYQVGYNYVPGYGIIPLPWMLWPENLQKWILPANICWALGWACEWTSHLEELCFWAFLVRPNPLYQSWIGSWNFWVWVAGSVTGFGLLPFMAVWPRADPIKTEAWIVLTGSIGSTIITFSFFWILWIFPGFLDRVRTEGAGRDVVTRLVTFHKINITRVCFRLLFCLPLLALGIDGVNGIHGINAIPFWVDLFAVMGGIGCMVSSIMTLFVFFPRSMSREAGYNSKLQTSQTQMISKNSYNSPAVDSANPFAAEITSKTTIIEHNKTMWELEEANRTAEIRIPHHIRYPPNERRRKKTTSVHPNILNFRSPIDMD